VRIVHTGLLHKGQRDPEPLLRAIVALRNEGRLEPGDLTVDFYGSRIKVAADLANSPAYAPFIRIIGHVPHEQALAAQAEADRVLLLESADPKFRGGLTGKIFEYVASGTPILSLGSPHGTAIWDLIAQTGTGICCGTDEQAIKREVLLLKENRGRPQWYRPKPDEVLKYSRERQAATMLDFILETVGRKNRESAL
jgi:glycosyltransferase involved in cell wall biosynthesis